MGQPIPDTQLGGHVLLIPNLAYDITDITSTFIFYGAAFENRLNLNTFRTWVFGKTLSLNLCSKQFHLIPL